MSNMARIVYITTLLAVGGLSYAAGRMMTAPVAEFVPVRDAIPVAVSAADSEAVLDLRRAESEIAALKAELSRMRTAAAEKAPVADPPAAPMAVDAKMDFSKLLASATDSMEQLKRKNPEKYAAVTAVRDQLMKSFRDARARQDSFLQSIDLSLLSEEERANHAAYLEVLERSTKQKDALRDAVPGGGQLSQESLVEIAQTGQELSRLRESERTALANAVGKSVGLDEAGSAELFSVFEDIYKATEPGMPSFMPNGIDVQVLPGPIR